MKSLSLSTSILLLSILGIFAQGTINFSTYIPGVLVAHVYGFNIALPEPYQKTGNTVDELPAGTQTYGGSLLTGSGYCAQLWYAPGAGQPENWLMVLPGSTTTFRTGTTFGGTPVPLTLVVPSVAAGTGVGTFQVRAWDNAGGTITLWDNAIFRGESALFEVTNLGDGGLTPPANLANFRSFELWSPLPEPSTFSLLSLGALGLWLFRRRRNALSANRRIHERSET